MHISTLMVYYVKWENILKQLFDFQVYVIVD